MSIDDSTTDKIAGDCTEVVVDYVRRLHASAGTTTAPVYLLRDDEWVRGDDGVTRRQPVTHPSLGGFPLSFDASHEPLHSAVLAAIRQDRDFGAVVGGLVGDDSGAQRFDEGTVLAYATAPIVDKRGQISFDEEAVRTRIQDVRAFVTATQRSSTAIIPLPGLTSGGFSVVVGPGIEIDNLTEAEVNACARAGVLRPMFEHMNMLEPAECVGVRIAVTTSAVRYPPGSIPDAAAMEAAVATGYRFGDRSRFHLPEMLEDVLLVLRLARPEFIGANGIVLTHSTLLGTGQTWQTRQTRPFLRTSYVLDNTTATTVAGLWAALVTLAPSNKPPRIALRRFNAAVDRASLDDAVVDHLIAAEALFLQDAGSPDDRTELGYRLSLRMALFLEAAGRDRHSTFRFMRSAYRLRSRISHGGTSVPEVAVSGQDTLPLPQFVDELAAVMRDALRLAVEHYRSDSAFGSAAWWDRLILGPPS